VEAPRDDIDQTNESPDAEEDQNATDPVPRMVATAPANSWRAPSRVAPGDSRIRDERRLKSTPSPKRVCKIRYAKGRIECVGPHGETK